MDYWKEYTKAELLKEIDRKLDGNDWFKFFPEYRPNLGRLSRRDLYGLLGY